MSPLYASLDEMEEEAVWQIQNVFGGGDMRVGI